MSLEGKVAIVTGAAQGLGAEFALALAHAGADIVIGDIIAADDIVRRIENLGRRCIATHLDVCERASVEACAALALSSFGGIHVLVNNAGLFTGLTFKDFTEISPEEWDRVMVVNVRGSFECARAVAPAMRSQSYGKIINLASGTAYKGTPGLLHYVASKGAVVSMTRGLARELGSHGITVNALSPGLTMSENTKTNTDWGGEVAKGNIASRALKREAVPDDLVGALLFLSSAASDFMTGQILTVDGGSVM